MLSNLPVENRARKNFRIIFTRNLSNPLVKAIILTQNDKFSSSPKAQAAADGYAVEAAQSMLLAHVHDNSKESMSDILKSLTDEFAYKLIVAYGETFTHPTWLKHKHIWEVRKLRYPFIDTNTAIPVVTQMVRRVFENPSLSTADCVPANSEQYVFISTPSYEIYKGAQENLGDVLGAHNARSCSYRGTTIKLTSYA